MNRQTAPIATRTIPITREMIIEEAFHIARTEGADKITSRRIAESLQCSTQPVLYHFATVEEALDWLKKEVNL